MKSMIEMLESRTLLSAGSVAAGFAPMQAGITAALTVTVYTSPLGRYTAPPASSKGGTLVIQQWNTTAGTMKFKLIKSDGTIELHTGTLSGRTFTSQFQGRTTRITTITCKVAKNYASAVGTYVEKNLSGVLKNSGTFSFFR